MEINKEVIKVQAFGKYLKGLLAKENYAEIFQLFSGSGNFRAVPFPVSETAVVFRCRPHSKEFIGKHFTKAEEIGYNRNSAIIGYGRCNIPKQGVGYYSQTAIAACLETIKAAKKGEVYELTIGAWEIKESLKLHCIVEPNKEKRVHPYEQDLGEWFDKEMAKRDKPIAELFQAYFTFLNEQIKGEAEGFGYQITAAYANKCYEISDGVAYSSVIVEDSYNISLKKEIEDEGKLLLTNVCKIKFEVLKDNPRSESELKVEYLENCVSMGTDRKSFQWHKNECTFRKISFIFLHLKSFFKGIYRVLVSLFNTLI